MLVEKADVLVDAAGVVLLAGHAVCVEAILVAEQLKADADQAIVVTGRGAGVTRVNLLRPDAADYSRVNPPALSDYQSANTDAFMPIDVVADLEAVTRDKANWPIVTRRLCSMNGGAFVALPEPGTLDAGWYDQLGQLAKDNGEIAGRLCTAAADGKVEKREILDLGLIAACDDAILHLVNLRARFERIVEEGR